MLLAIANIVNIILKDIFCIELNIIQVMSLRYFDVFYGGYIFINIGLYNDL